LLLGKEIYIFFAQYGLNGIYGILVSCILFSIVIYKVFSICCEKHILTYTDFLDFILGEKLEKLKLNFLINTIINLFLLISFFIMISGFGAFLKQELNIPYLIGIILICILCYITFNKNVEGITKVNLLLTPLLIFFIILIGIVNYFHICSNNISLNIPDNNSFISLINGIVYCSYNSIVMIPILISLKKYLEPKNILKISVISSFILFILSITVFSILFTIDIDINYIDLPLIYATSILGILFEILYSFVFLSAVFTSAISARIWISN